jgi:hypothetical protein
MIGDTLEGGKESKGECLKMTQKGVPPTLKILSCIWTCFLTVLGHHVWKN